MLPEVDRCPESNSPSTCHDLDAAVDFYSKLFGAEPAKRQPGLRQLRHRRPPLKLVLIEDRHCPRPRRGRRPQPPGGRGEHSRRGGGRHPRSSADGLETAVEDQTTCCYAVQDKVWVSDPDGAPWEVYTVLADARPPNRHRRRRVLLHP